MASIHPTCLASCPRHAELKGSLRGDRPEAFLVEAAEPRVRAWFFSQWRRKPLGSG